jgi:hypothetical protein
MWIFLEEQRNQAGENVRKEALSQWPAAQGIEGKWLENELEDAWRFMTSSPVSWET